MSSRNKKTTNFTSMANAMMNDPSLRALKNKDTFEETIKMFQLGLKAWNYSAIMGFLQTVRRSASIEKVNSLFDNYNYNMIFPTYQFYIDVHNIRQI